jgi:alpha-L-fucosidase
MQITILRMLLMTSLIGLCGLTASAQTSSSQTTQTTPLEPIQPGPFTASDTSLAEHYRYPKWFQDAKLGIWAHWGPQSVPMSGDWYARNMYIQGSGQYQHHLENYGPPSKTGYKDIIPLWKAEKWDPDRLMALYKKAGARYFVSMACHHDNFDLWNSKYHRWNAVNMGPKRDVVGTWQRAAKRQGLKFGVSEHLAASFTWFQPSHGSDKTGPFAGVPYDGADPQYQDLYHRPTAPDDRGWMTTDPQSQAEWYQRIRDLVDHYQPDLLYSDSGLPFGNDVGRSLIADFYNGNALHHGGTTEAVYTCKQESGGKWAQDLERGVMAKVNPYPWQSDTSIGDWFYNKNWKYRGTDWVIHSLVDIVSKNGNLLINVVQRPDGSLDPEAEQILHQMADWVAINGEGIFGTRPWLIYGEGPVRAKGGAFGEDFAFSAHDIRFTTKGDNTLYAFAMGWPQDGKITIHTLANLPGVTGTIRGVSLLGYQGKLSWKQDADGLTVELPTQKPCDYAITLKITGKHLRGFKPELMVPSVMTVKPDASGNYRLMAEDADLKGTLHTETRGGASNIGYWDNATDSATWQVSFPIPGKYRVTATCATINPSAVFDVELNGNRITGKVTSTGAWDNFVEVEVGTIEVSKTGETMFTIQPKDKSTWAAINLREVRLTRENP